VAQLFIGIGSTINRLANIQSGLASLKKVFGKLTISTVYESEAVGFSGENFYNLVVGFESALPVKELISVLKRIEIEPLKMRLF